ncbi:unnamed protein product, partial [Prorocentrum cordatum]
RHPGVRLRGPAHACRLRCAAPCRRSDGGRARRRARRRRGAGRRARRRRCWPWPRGGPARGSPGSRAALAGSCWLPPPGLLPPAAGALAPGAAAAAGAAGGHGGLHAALAAGPG